MKKALIFALCFVMGAFFVPSYALTIPTDQPYITDSFQRLPPLVNTCLTNPNDVRYPQIVSSFSPTTTPLCTRQDEGNLNYWDITNSLITATSDPYYTQYSIAIGNGSGINLPVTLADQYLYVFSANEYGYNSSCSSVVKDINGNPVAYPTTAWGTQSGASGYLANALLNPNYITDPLYLNYVDVRNNNGNPDNTWYVNPANSSLTNTTQWYFGTPPVTGGLKKLALLGVG